MKLSAVLSLALAGHALAGEECGAKAVSAMNAIGKFCQKAATGALIVPSYTAQYGMNGYDARTHVKITGNCKPAQWVPYEYCMSQFEAMCSNGGKHGAAKAKYGRNGCQHWEISYTPTAGQQ